MIDKLIAAQNRGVKVTALIPKYNDEPIFDKLGIMTTNQLLMGNVEVYWSGFKTHRFSHSKAMSIDNVWSTLGSANADHRAFYVNQELNIAISDSEFTQELNSRFFDFHVSIAQKAEYTDLPWYKKPLYSFLEGVDKIF